LIEENLSVLSVVPGIGSSSSYPSFGRTVACARTSCSKSSGVAEDKLTEMVVRESERQREIIGGVEIGL